jgi:hypothetical protein
MDWSQDYAAGRLTQGVASAFSPSSPDMDDASGREDPKKPSAPDVAGIIEAAVAARLPSGRAAARTIAASPRAPAPFQSLASEEASGAAGGNIDADGAQHSADPLDLYFREMRCHLARLRT